MVIKLFGDFGLVELEDSEYVVDGETNFIEDGAEG